MLPISVTQSRRTITNCSCFAGVQRREHLLQALSHLWQGPPSGRLDWLEDSNVKFVLFVETNDAVVPKNATPRTGVCSAAIEATFIFFGTLRSESSSAARTPTKADSCVQS